MLRNRAAWMGTSFWLFGQAFTPPLQSADFSCRPRALLYA